MHHADCRITSCTLHDTGLWMSPKRLVPLARTANRILRCCVLKDAQAPPRARQRHLAADTLARGVRPLQSMDTGLWTDSVGVLQVVLTVLNVIVYAYCVLWVRPELPAFRVCTLCGSSDDRLCVGGTASPAAQREPHAVCTPARALLHS